MQREAEPFHVPIVDLGHDAQEHPTHNFPEAIAQEQQPMVVEDVSAHEAQPSRADIVTQLRSVAAERTALQERRSSIERQVFLAQSRDDYQQQRLAATAELRTLADEEQRLIAQQQTLEAQFRTLERHDTEQRIFGMSPERLAERQAHLLERLPRIDQAMSALHLQLEQPQTTVRTAELTAELRALEEELNGKATPDSEDGGIRWELQCIDRALQSAEKKDAA